MALDVEGLRKGLLAEEFTSVDLVNVFGKRCYEIGRRLCLSTEEDFEEALLEAAKMDGERKKAIAEGKADQLPPLHGIPVSVKDLVILN